MWTAKVDQLNCLAKNVFSSQIHAFADGCSQQNGG
jgi:hypothetical protein